MFLTTFSALLILQQTPAEDVDWDKEFGVEERVRDPETGEFPVEPYEQSDSNSGAEPFDGDRLGEAFGGRDGIQRIANRTVELSEADPRIADIFIAHDMVRLKRTLSEQFCYLLNAGCSYSGRDMRASHTGLGVTKANMNALVENLQKAMREADVPFAAQNKLLSKLAPMSKHIVER